MVADHKTESKKSGQVFAIGPAGENLVKIASIINNKEVSDLLTVLGLKIGTKYESTKKLRYGKLCFLTDADVDGSHIKGLLMNFIDMFWPELISLKFLWSLNTPIVKAKPKGNGKGKKAKFFYTIPEYNEWNKKTNTDNWYIKYYKGLGTSTPDEAKECFKIMKENMTMFVPDKTGRQFIELAFKKSKVPDRKTWIQNYDRETQFVSEIKPKMGVTEFVDKELILFSVEDNERSIPSVVDGLKVGQRKALWFGMNRKNFESEESQIKVASYAGFLVAEMGYHHGQDSVANTIIGMAQNFVGSNNVNLLYPEGAFGTRIQGGKDAASSRYTYTYLSENTRKFFPKMDDSTMNLLTVDGEIVEPEFLVPTIPMVLVNGAAGIGTGFSTNVPCYNPVDIRANIIRLMNNEEMVPMTPWYRGFNGTIEKKSDTQFVSIGKYTMSTGNTVVVTELPIGRWTDDYKKWLLKLEDTGDLTFDDIVDRLDLKEDGIVLTKDPEFNLPGLDKNR